MNGPRRNSATKTWIRQHPYLAVVLGYAIFLVVVTTVVGLTNGSLDVAEILFQALMYSLVYWLPAFFQARTVRRTKERLDAHGQSKAYLRYPDARPGSLSGTWNQGIATPAEGSLRFQPAVYDNLEPSGRATDFVVQEVLPERRKVRRNERKYLWDVGYEVVTLLTDKGRVQVAASPETLDSLVELLASGPGTPS
ncbi:hypothetical protein [Arthrobacter sp. IK3]|uniref:hypothetical protein n=1 Tax=Arthrobacter sp. IK3 TaxID=3448169 RepID=UPI003EDFE67E